MGRPSAARQTDKNNSQILITYSNSDPTVRFEKETQVGKIRSAPVGKGPYGNPPYIRTLFVDPEKEIAYHLVVTAESRVVRVERRDIVIVTGTAKILALNTKDLIFTELVLPDKGYWQQFVLDPNTKYLYLAHSDENRELRPIQA